MLTIPALARGEGHRLVVIQSTDTIGFEPDVALDLRGSGNRQC